MKIADISKWQGDVDWDVARKELEFVILRASCGNSIDSKFIENAARCGIPFGVYHYVKAATADESRAEARFFVECVRKADHQPSFYIADIEHETQNESTTESVCVAFLEELRILGCKKIGLYINTRYKWAGRAIAMCDIMWIPRYGKNTGEIPGEQYFPKYPCDMWQYTSVGSLAGVKGNVDLNTLTGSRPLDYFTERKDSEAPVSIDPKKVIDIALAEVGYLEKASNSQLDDKTANAGSKNFTKYARDLDAIGFYNGKKNGYAWCDVFADWVFVKAFGKDIALAITFQPTDASKNCGAGCTYSRQYYQKNGRLFNDPQPGDQIFFWSSDKSRVSHTGLVVAVDSTYVYTVEGNTSSASGVIANGGCVAQKKYKLNYNRIAGYGRPKYEITVTEPAQPQPEPVEPTISGKSVVIKCSSDGKVNIRQGDSTDYPIITRSVNGDTYEYVATSPTGWHGIRCDKCIAWVSPKYSDVIGG